VLPDYSARARVQPAPSPASGPPEASKEAPKQRVQTALGQPWRVQLAAFRSRETAEEEVARLETAHAALFDPFGGLKVFEAVLPKGTFYRVGTGPVTDRNTATALCKDLKAQALSCIVVR
jgi:cell division septation protein DedD